MKKKKKAVRLAAASGILLWSLAIPVYGVEYNDDTAVSYASRYGTDEEAIEREGLDYVTGPGAKTAMTVSAETESGPTIQDITMSERYHDDFELYEQSLNGQYFLYTTVSNGGITDQAVYVDIPAGLVYAVEKDGVPIAYTSRQYLTGKGTYVMRFTAIRDNAVPLSEQEEYRAVFRFRIDEKVTRTEEAGSGIADASGEVWHYGLPENDGTTAAGELTTGEPVAGETGTEDAASEETAAESELESPAETEAGDGAAEEVQAEIRNPSRQQIYQPENSMYQVELEDGFQFRSSVPEGMITTQPVKLLMEPEEHVILYLDDVEYGYEKDRDLNEYGTYHLVSGDNQFAFQITNSYVNAVEYQAPVGMVITVARFQDQTMDIGDSSFIPMKEDGKYSITIVGQADEKFTVTLNRDSQPPEVTVAVGRQQADITYLSDDISEITLAKDGKSPQAFTGTTVTSPGQYVLAVTDRAGNVTSQEFTLRFHMNFYALAAIVLIAVGIIIGIVFLIRKKKNLTVR